MSNLGLADAIPGVGNVLKQGPTFFWHQRATPGLGETSFVGTRTKKGNDRVFPFGISSNIILRPDGTVVLPSDTGILNTNGNSGGSATCSEILTSGYLWKPASQDTNAPRVGYPGFLLNRYAVGTSCLQLLSANLQPFSCLGLYSGIRYYEGYGCGLQDESPCSGRTRASDLAAMSQTIGGTVGGYIFDPNSKRCFEVPNFASRHDVRR